jgi:predicted nucleic acid-binding Zn ribbon protein
MHSLMQKTLLQNDFLMNPQLSRDRFKRNKSSLINVKSEEPQRIGPIVEAVLSEKGYLTSCKEYGILLKWPSIVEKGLAKASTCERVENGVVYVKIFSGSWRQEALYQKETLIKRIQTEFGCPTIKDIVFY